MRAFGLCDDRSELRLLDLPVPKPAADEILIRVSATSINPIDVLVAQGRYRWGAFTYPVVPGWDFAGSVVDAGADVERFRVGDEVFGYWSKPTFHDGAWAEYVTIPEHGVVARRPPQLDETRAAALPLAAVTAVLAIDGVAPVRDEVVLVVGAGGAVGTYVVQLAAQRGAKVIATAKPHDVARMRALGASHTIDYQRLDVVDAMAELGLDEVPVLVDIVNDPPEVARLAGRLVRDGGRVASARFAADQAALRTRGITVVNVGAQHCDGEPLERLAAMVAAGELDVMVDDVRPFSDLPQAVVDMAQGGRGKIVLSLVGATDC